MAKTVTSNNDTEQAEIKVRKPRAPRATKVEVETVEERESLLDSFVFMDKAKQILDIGIKTEKNVILYGPGGHGKSELALEFFRDKGIEPYVITMGTGMTTDRLFGGIDIKKLDDDGMLEYLVENSFMEHEYVIFEELMDAPDFILEQLKDILSSGFFRNGTQVFRIKTKFIVGNTNKTREEFAKNLSLRALMERFPLELNVVWEHYTDVTYNKLLESRFGVGRVDPTIPFILAEYVKQGVTISPRIALDCYSVFETCGPDSLNFFADFSSKPAIIKSALGKFKAALTFKQMAGEVEEIIAELESNTSSNESGRTSYMESFTKLKSKLTDIAKLTVQDDLAANHAKLISFTKKAVGKFQEKNDTFATMYKGKVQKEEKEDQGPGAPSMAQDSSAPKKRKSSYNYGE